MDPDHDNPKEKPPSRELTDLDPKEREFWDLEDAEDLPEEPGDDDAEALQDDPAADPEPTQEAQEPEEKPESDPEPHEDSDPEPDLDLESEEEEEEASLPTSEEPEEEPDSGETSGLSSSLTRREILWMSALGVVLLTGIIYAIVLFFKHVPTEREPDAVDFPVKGDKVVIREIETYWRKPDRDNDQGIHFQARLIPVASVKLKSGQGRCALRFFFEDDQGQIIGDPVTRVVMDGEFAASGGPEADLHASDGFRDEASHAGYSTEENLFWYLVVKEGPGPDALGQDFKEILRMRISSKRR